MGRKPPDERLREGRHSVHRITDNSTHETGADIRSQHKEVIMYSYTEAIKDDIEYNWETHSAAELQ